MSAAPIPPPRSPLGRPDPEADGFRILLVEDDAGDALLVEEMLADTGLEHTLLVARTLGQSLEELRQRDFDCVLLDLNLPDGSGAPLLRSVLDAAPAAVIVLTGMSEAASGAEAVAVGAQDYLVKGQVDAPSMRRALRYAVHRKQAEHANAELIENRLRAEENARLERGLLPPPLLQNSSTVTATTRYLPGREHALLGGDFLDVVQTPDGLVHAVIGDVSGHGPDEAALGVCLRITWRALLLAGHRDIGLLDVLEQVFVAERARPELFATCMTLTLDPGAGTATILLAGHHEPLLTDGAKSEPVSARHGTALGIAPGRHNWHPAVVRLPESGALFLYTDGLVEGHEGDGSARLGLSGLLELMAKAPERDAGRLLDYLVDSVRALDRGRHSDDLAILHLAWDLSGSDGLAGRLG